MSPYERNAWIRLVAIVVVFVPYFGSVAWLFDHDAASPRLLCVAFLAAGVAHGLLTGGGQLLAQAFFGREFADERDRAIEALALRVAYFVLITLVLGSLSTLATVGLLSPPLGAWLADPRVLPAACELAFGAVVAAEAARHATQVACYRRDARVDLALSTAA